MKEHLPFQQIQFSWPLAEDCLYHVTSHKINIISICAVSVAPREDIDRWTIDV